MGAFAKASGRLRRKLYRLGRARPVYVVSFPKCGRTWLRYMLEQYLESVAGIDSGRIAEGGQALRPRARPYPPAVFTHDDDPDEKRPGELSWDKTRFAGARVAFLARDPRDVAVSIYFEKTKRSHLYRARSRGPEKIGDLLGDHPGGLRTIVAYYNAWWANRATPAAFLLLRYEDMLADPKDGLRRFCAFAGYPVDETAIAAAVRAADFSRMRCLEATGGLSFKLSPGDKGDPESYKTRRGVAGGFTGYFGPEEVEAATAHLRRNLPDAFGYPGPEDRSASPGGPRDTARPDGVGEGR